MKEWKLGYAAGVIDGEGAICIGKIHSPSCSPGHRFALQVLVNNIRKELCEWLQDNFGGGLWRAGITTAGNTVWRWQLANAKAGEFLSLVRPYLVTKRAKADIGIAFQARRKRGRGRRSAEDWDLDREQKRQIEATK